jgi:hypothetical protein
MADQEEIPSRWGKPVTAFAISTIDYAALVFGDVAGPFVQ